MKVIEQFVEGKDPDPALCEDLILVTGDFAVVVDGATDKAGVDFDGRSGGLVAAEALRDAFLELDREAELADLVGEASASLAERIAEAGAGIDPLIDDGPSASFVAFSDCRREVWRVGDCSWMTESETVPGGKAIDGTCANARAALLRALLERGVGEDELLKDDPGRAMIMPLLRNQHLFRNLEEPASGYTFGAIDGREVPRRFQEVWSVSEAGEIVLASDGYPVLKPTLEQTEAELADELALDPLRIGRHPATKGLAPGLKSFDDRAYLRIGV